MKSESVRRERICERGGRDEENVRVKDPCECGRKRMERKRIKNKKQEQSRKFDEDEKTKKK